MNKQLVTLSDALSVEEAWEQIKNHDIKYYPIIGAEGKLLGLLSEGEILRHLHEGKRKSFTRSRVRKPYALILRRSLLRFWRFSQRKKLKRFPLSIKKLKWLGS